MTGTAGATRGRIAGIGGGLVGFPRLAFSDQPVVADPRSVAPGATA